MTDRVYFELADGRVVRVDLAPIWLRPWWTRQDYADAVKVAELVGENEIPCVRVLESPK